MIESYLATRKSVSNCISFHCTLPALMRRIALTDFAPRYCDVGYQMRCNSSRGESSFYRVSDDPDDRRADTPVDDQNHALG